MDFEALDLTRQELESLDMSDYQVVLGANLTASLGVREGEGFDLNGQPFEVAAVLLESGP